MTKLVAPKRLGVGFRVLKPDATLQMDLGSSREKERQDSEKNAKTKGSKGQ
jgi:hypothetical protein